MRYLDSGQRSAAHSLAVWLQNTLDDEVSELRWQTGYFSDDVLPWFSPVLERLAAEGSLVRVVVGSNDAFTTRGSLVALVAALGLPRAGAQLGVVSYANGLYHPKTVHLRRSDGSQAAVVGSANLTFSGAALNIEAVIVLDTRDGDASPVLDEIAAAVDAWFVAPQGGLYLVDDVAVVDRLVADAVVGVDPVPQPRRVGGSTSATGAPQQTRLSPLVGSPGPRRPRRPPQPAVTLAVGSWPGYPSFLVFAPGLTTATVGLEALSGATLPGGAPGLIIRLTKDSARHFAGRGGTANISLPLATVPVLRFGMEGDPPHPRAVFELRMRYLSDRGAIVGRPSDTSVMAYGYGTEETSHANVRLVLTKAAKELAADITAAGDQVPVPGALAFLEWPFAEAPSFRISFLDPTSHFGTSAQAFYHAAVAAKQLLGGACLLPANFSPPW